MSEDPSERDHVKASLSRRELMKRALVAGGVGYVAPMVLGTATPARAQTISGVCTSCTDTSGGGDPACGSGFICVDRVGESGSPICTWLGGLFCDNFDSCSSDDDCDPGFFCVDCNGGQCMSCTVPA